MTLAGIMYSGSAQAEEVPQPADVVGSATT